MPVNGSITLSQFDGVRFLHFGTRVAQGAMSIAKPNSLALSYSQDMMFWLMFADPPEKIVQFGLGAGSLAKFCLANFRQTCVTAVELSRVVIDVAVSSFQLPIHEPRLQIECTDAAAFVKESPCLSGGILLSDVFDAISAGPVLDTQEYYLDCERFVGGAEGQFGMAVFNLWGLGDFEQSLEKIRFAFKGKVILLDRLREGNVIVGAFTGPPLNLSEKQLEKRAILISLRYGLPAERWFNAMCNFTNRSVWERPLAPTVANET
jgi:spermidine synthase